MDRLELQKLRDLPIEGVAERLGLRVTRHKALCPFHDDHHASLSFRVSKNTFRCFVCGTQSGGPIDLVMRHLNNDFKAACRWLADENNIILEGVETSDYQTISHQDRSFRRQSLRAILRTPLAKRRGSPLSLRRAPTRPSRRPLVPPDVVDGQAGNTVAADTVLRP